MKTNKIKLVDLSIFEEALLISNTGKGSKGGSYNNLGKLNQAAWIGERSGTLIDEIKLLRAIVEASDKLVEKITPSNCHGSTAFALVEIYNYREARNQILPPETN